MFLLFAGFVFVVGFSTNEALSSSGKNVVSYTHKQRYYSVQYYDANCGLWSWSTCKKSRQVARYHYMTMYKCKDGWTTLDAVNCDTAICQNQPAGMCANGGSCRTPNSCSCPPGYSEPACADINECNTNNGECEQICINSPGSHRCQCKPGYLPRNSAASCDPHCLDGCANGGTCSAPNYCTCRLGFQSPSCDDTDECERNNGGCNQICRNTFGSFRCSCEEGFYLTDDFKTCKNESLDACFSGNNQTRCPVCQYKNDTECVCPDQLFLTNAGRRCSPACMYGMCLNEASCSDVKVELTEPPTTPTTPTTTTEATTTEPLSTTTWTTMSDLRLSNLSAESFEERVISSTNRSVSNETTDSAVQQADDVTFLGAEDSDSVDNNRNNSNITSNNYDAVFYNTSRTTTAKPVKYFTLGFICHCERIPFHGKFCEHSDTESEWLEKIKTTPTTTVETTTDPTTTTTTIELTTTVTESTTVETSTESTTQVTTEPLDLGEFYDMPEWDSQNKTEREDDVKRIKRNCKFIPSSDYISGRPFQIQAPDSIVLQVEKGYQQIKITSFPTFSRSIRICADEGLRVEPTVIKVNPPNTETSLKVSSSKRGMFKVLFLQSSKDEPLAIITILMEDVFTRLNLPEEALPQGTNYLDVEFRGTHFRFSSTSEWCKSLTNKNLHFTKGMVFSSSGNTSLPLSVSGLEVNVGKKKLFIGNVSSHRDFTNCLKPSGKSTRSKRDYIQQIFRFINNDDQKDLSGKQVLLSTVFKQLTPKLPPWFRIESVKDESETAKVHIMSGFRAQRLSPCFGMPLKEKIMYHVYLFTHPLRMSLLNQTDVLPKLKGQEYCMVVDLNQDQGATVAFKFPEYVDADVTPLQLFSDILKRHNVEMFPFGFGVSFPGRLNGHRRPLGELGSIKDEHYYDAKSLVGNPAASVTLWNGDTMFSYPTKKNVNIWLQSVAAFSVGQEGVAKFEVKTSFEAFLTVPDMSKALDQLITKPVETNFRTTAGFNLNTHLWIAGKKFSIDLNNVGANLFSVEVFGYMSILGKEEREYCGSSANPPGVFLEANINAQLLRGIPYLQDKVAELTFSNIDVKVQFFKIMDEGFAVIFPWDRLKYTIKGMKSYMKRVRNSLEDASSSLTDSQGDVIGDDIAVMQRQLDSVGDLADAALEAIAKQDLTDLSDTFLREIRSLDKLARDLNNRVDVTFNRALSETASGLYKKIHHLDSLSSKFFNTMLNALKDSMFKGTSTWGIRGRFSIVILGDLYALQGYFIQADEVVSRCGHTSTYFDHMRGEKSMRVFGKVEFPIQILPKVKIDTGFGVEIAFSLSSTNFVVRLHAAAKFLGIKAKIDLFINNKGLHSVFEANIYDIFRARVTISANVFVPVSDWKVLLRVELMAGGDGFDGSLLDVLKNYVKKIAQDAYNRVQGAQNKVDDAKDKVQTAQQGIQKAKAVLDTADGKFDAAIAKLERAKEKLEKAKDPFRRTTENLNKAQRKVDSLCVIKTCNDICVPGIIPKLCWAGWFPYPCFKTTSCMIRIPNPICLVKNTACYVVRGLAYAALAIAKAAVRVPMLALDVAKVALSAAQVAVEVGRVAKNAAKGLLDAANVVMEGVKKLMDIAKAALEAVKILVKIGFQIFEFIVEKGLKSLFDIKSCGFEFVLSTKEGAEFEVFCNINPFRKGWRNVKFRINFNNILSSLWNAAKSIAKQFMNFVQNVFGRRKREIADDIIPRLVNIMRYKRATESFSNSTYNDDILEELFPNGTLLTNVSWEHDTEFWRERCSEYTPVYNFLGVALDILYNASTMVYQQVDDIQAKNEDNPWNSVDESSVPLQASEIDFGVAASEFNLTREDVLEALRSANVSEDSLVHATRNATDYVRQQGNQTADTISKFDVLLYWKLQLNNISKEHFLEEECASFSDCVMWSFIQLSTVFSAVEPRLVPNAVETMTKLEFLFDDLLENSTKPVADVKNSSLLGLELLAQLDFNDIFCGEAPTMTKHPANGTVLMGGNFNLSCGGIGVPRPTYYWYKDDELFMHGTDTIYFTNASLWDEANYTCVVGNHIMNVSSEDVSLIVVYPPTIVSEIKDYVEFVKGDAIKLACKTDSKPAALTTWRMTNPGGSATFTHELFLNSTNTSASGIYSCKGLNEYGSDVSKEIMVDIKASYPACPSLEIEFGFIVASVKQGSSLNSAAKDILAFDHDLVVSTVSDILDTNDLAMSVDILTTDREFDMITIAVDVDCSNTSECFKLACVEAYTNMTRKLKANLAALDSAIDEERFLFSHRGLDYHFNRGLVEFGQIIPKCPQNYTMRVGNTCVYTGQLYSLPTPSHLDVVDNGLNITVTWQPPDYLQHFLQGYTLSIILHGEVEAIRVMNLSSSYRSCNLNRYTDFKRGEKMYAVKLRAFTNSYKSDWSQVQVDLITKADVDIVFAVLMALLFVTIGVVAVMAGIYHLKSPKITKVSQLTPVTPTPSPPPAYSVTPPQEIACLTKKPGTLKPAWE